MTANDDAFAPPASSDTQTADVADLRPLWRVLAFFQLAELVGLGGMVAMIAALAEDESVSGMAAVMLGAYTTGFGVVWFVGQLIWIGAHVALVRNLRRLGQRLDYGWVYHVFGWFVPLANLFIGFRAMQELSSRSAALGRPGPLGWAAVRSPERDEVNRWWTYAVLQAMAALMPTPWSWVWVPIRALATFNYLQVMWRIAENQWNTRLIPR